MATFIGQLSDAEIKAVADYYAAQGPALKTLLRRNWL
jgi:cytochrome c553